MINSRVLAAFASVVLLASTALGEKDVARILADRELGSTTLVDDLDSFAMTSAGDLLAHTTASELSIGA